MALSQVISVVSGKGGTGKTTFTALVGAALARAGRRTLLIDCDIGLRNLDLALGMSDRAVMDFSDVCAGRTTLDAAAAQHPEIPNLFLLTAPVGGEDCGVSPEAMASLLREVREQFDVCLIDAAAGLGASFRLATSHADRVIVVANTDPTSLRDAQRTVMELNRFPQGKLHLVINRLRVKLLRELHENIDNAIDTAGLPLLGVIPDDDAVPRAIGRGAVGSLTRSAAETAAQNIARRLCGVRVRLMKL